MWLVALYVLCAVLFGYPLAALVCHGLDPSLWPREVLAPSVWLETWRGLRVDLIVETYWRMLLNRSLAFAGGFWALILLLLSPALIIGWRLAGSAVQTQRDASNLFGGARFAILAERAAFSRGLELGIDPETGRAVRVAVQGTLASIAPPRKGKTSGQLIPNLAYPEVGSWSGPAVVIDPKGEIYRATAERRRALGRRVICLDPVSLVKGSDRWNPLHERDPNDVLYLQHTALALLPEASGDGEASAYFRNRAVDLITGALLVTLTRGNRTVTQVQALIANSDLMIKQLEPLRPAPAALAALEILKADPKTRDPIVATASQAFQWLADSRMRDLVGGSTFALSDLAVEAMKVVHPGLRCEAGVAKPTNPDRSTRMNVHQHARMTVHGRALLVSRIRQEGWRVMDAARAAGVSERTAYKWLARFRACGERMLHDRSSAPARPPRRLSPETVTAIERLRRQRLSGPAIARKLGQPRSTVGAVLRRLGLGRLAALEPKPPVLRYERERPGELIHIDTKKLGRIARPSHRVTGNRRDRVVGTGWEHLHVAVDDASRLAYTEVLPSERKEDAVAFLSRALAFFAAHGVSVERVMTDNGSAYKSLAFRNRLADAGLRHIRTKPYTPRTNGKAERFIQTSLREWAYARTYQTSAERAHAMQPWITAYNSTRPHSALGGKPPLTRLSNVLGFDI